jgi:RIP metalloprotease RseP
LSTIAPPEPTDDETIEADTPAPVRFAGLRLAALLGSLVLIGLASPWTLAVILALVVMIFLHELGHYVMAKRAGMKVTEFFIGFGPRIWSFHRGETEYGIKVIPAGAYVKIIGMHNLESVAAADEARTYRQKGFWPRIGVAVAGSTMHFILAIGLIYVALVGIGQPSGTLDPMAQQRAWFIESVVPGSGAADAGLQPGDRITAIDGEPIETFADLRAVAGEHQGETVPIAYVRDGQTVETELTLKPFMSWVIDRVPSGSALDAAGVTPGTRVETVGGRSLTGATSGEELEELLADLDGTTPVVFEVDDELVTVPVDLDTLALAGVPGYVGIGRGLPGDEKVGPLEGLVAAPREFATITTTSLGALGRFFTPGGISDFAGQVMSARDDRATADEEQRQATEPVTETTSRVVEQDGDESAGENRLLSIYGLVTIGSDLGEVNPASLIVLFAMINVFIGVFNLVPLLPFDGGHVAIAVYERVQELRLRRRRYFADVGRLVPFANLVVLVMAMLFASTIYLDIANPLVAR